MNNFLVSAGPSLAANLSPTPFRDTFDSFLSDLKLTRITIDQTLEVIDSIDIRKSSAIDCLTSRGLKDAFNGLPIQLKFIFNLSIDVGTFPASWKRANIILIPKEGPNATQTIIAQFPCCLFQANCLRSLYIIGYLNFETNKKF